MIDFKCASKGTAKIFTGEILELISLVAIMIGGALGIAALAFAGEESVEGFAVSGIAALVLIIGGAVVAVIAYIFELIGFNKAGSQNGNFKTALYLVLFSFALTIVNAIISMVAKSDLSSSIVMTVKTALDAAVTIFVLNGCYELLTEKGNTSLAEQATTVQSRVMIAFILAAILQFIPGFVDGIADTIMTIASAICTVIAYIQYLIILKKASKSFAEE